MTQKEAKLFIAKVEPLGTINYALMNRQAPTIQPKYGLKLPAPPATMIVGGSGCSYLNRANTACMLHVSDEIRL